MNCTVGSVIAMTHAHTHLSRACHNGPGRAPSSGPSHATGKHTHRPQRRIAHGVAELRSSTESRDVRLGS
eukprot:6022704-Prymnesium_polylepis.2